MPLKCEFSVVFVLFALFVLGISESMAAFLTAEMLANKASMSDSQIETAMETAQRRQNVYNTAGVPQSKGTNLLQSILIGSNSC